jgi:hypothetical protein
MEFGQLLGQEMLTSYTRIFFIGWLVWRGSRVPFPAEPVMGSVLLFSASK